MNELILRTVLVFTFALLVGGCDSGGSTLASSQGLDLQSIAGAARLGQRINLDPLAQSGPGGYQNEPLRGKGGTIVFHSVKVKVKHKILGELDAFLSYAPNSLGKKKDHGALRDCACAFGPFPYPSGKVIDWMGFYADAEASFNIVFDPASLDFVISGSGLDPTTSYSLYVYTADCVGSCGSFSELSQSTLGLPVNGALQAPSPFENGYDMSPTNNTTVFVLAH